MSFEMKVMIAALWSGEIVMLLIIAKTFGSHDGDQPEEFCEAGAGGWGAGGGSSEYDEEDKFLVEIKQDWTWSNETKFPPTVKAPVNWLKGVWDTFDKCKRT